MYKYLYYALEVTRVEYLIIFVVSSLTRIIIVFVSDASHDKLSEMVGQLSEAMTGVKHEQEYMEVRERIHRSSKS
jgi:hypothetical protein